MPRDNNSQRKYIYNDLKTIAKPRWKRRTTNEKNLTTLKYMKLEEYNKKQLVYLIEMLKHKIKTMKNVKKHYRICQDNTTQLSTQKAALQRSLTACDVKVSDLNLNISSLQSTLDGRNRKIRSLEDNLTNLQHSNNELKENLTLCMIETKKNTQLKEEQEVTTQLNIQKAALQRSLTACDVKVSDLNLNISSLQSTLDGKNRMIRSLEEFQQSMKTQLQSSQNKIRVAESTLSSCQSSLNLRDNQAADCDRERVCQHNLTNLQHSNNELKENPTLCMIETKKNTKLKEEQEDTTQLKIQKAALQRSLTACDVKVSDLNLNISLLQSTLDGKNRKIRSLEDFQQSLKTQLQSSQDRFRVAESTLSSCQFSLSHRDIQVADCNSNTKSNNEKILDMERVLQHNLTNLQHSNNELKENLTSCMIEIEKNTKLKEEKEVNWGSAKPRLKEKYDNCPPFGNVTGAMLISVPNQQPFKVPCTEASDKYVWSIIERRLDQQLSFNRGWQEYRDGFGNFDREFFIGLEKLHLMTSSEPHKLLIRLTGGAETKNAIYSNFKIGSENEGYPITSLGTYSGDAGDGLRESLNQKFSTFDRDNDQVDDVNCAKDVKGGWWLTDCGKSNLNFNVFRKVFWNDMLGGPVSVEILIRPSDIDYN
ncbi:angiopoietin-4-like [Drosophila montana]|uniref:angiopoietin-4-like n=1 Tax=Drosophila montana TaxID=40370 RepID=UPI00313D85A9